ncbi:MAG: DUF2442 domain-containing protein [Halobacteriovoraceae bacterium]|nr:DUF2442 domain-containing protein [Halobacteriovoraceae bacterium]
MIRKILDVKANDDFTLECEMENGEIYKYDMSFVHKESGEVIEPLRNIELFKQVWVDYGALEWPNGYGIHGNTVAREGELIKKSA